jgi:hypothetical protein
VTFALEIIEYGFLYKMGGFAESIGFYGYVEGVLDRIIGFTDFIGRVAVAPCPRCIVILAAAVLSGK